jgi:predicted PurR-regulated permease PerM
MKKIWNWISKYAIMLIFGIVSLFALIWVLIKQITQLRIKKIDEQINKNNNDFAKLDGKVEQLETQKQDILDSVTTTKQELDILQAAKEQPIPHVDRTTAEARENILNKTTRRRKKDA